MPMPSLTFLVEFSYEDDETFNAVIDVTRNLLGLLSEDTLFVSSPDGDWQMTVEFQTQDTAIATSEVIMGYLPFMVDNVRTRLV